MVRGMYLWRRERGGERGREGGRKRGREEEMEKGRERDWRENLMLSM